jgi:hypothetical protein
MPDVLDMGKGKLFTWQPHVRQLFAAADVLLLIV